MARKRKKLSHILSLVSTKVVDLDCEMEDITISVVSILFGL